MTYDSQSLLVFGALEEGEEEEEKGKGKQLQWFNCSAEWTQPLYWLHVTSRN